MDSDLDIRIEESIALELNVSEIYSLFRDLFPRDAEFCQELVMEEKNHAALIRTGRDYFEPINKFPHHLLEGSLQELEDTNNYLRSLIQAFKETPPSREKAFQVALEIENSAGELHFQDFMEEKNNSKIDSIFKRLNNDDKDHALRISSYMEENGIPNQ
jgi:hypothetical protein